METFECAVCQITRYVSIGGMFSITACQSGVGDLRSLVRFQLGLVFRHEISFPSALAVLTGLTPTARLRLAQLVPLAPKKMRQTTPPKWCHLTHGKWGKFKSLWERPSTRKAQPASPYLQKRERDLI